MLSRALCILERRTRVMALGAGSGVGVGMVVEDGGGRRVKWIDVGQ